MNISDYVSQLQTLTQKNLEILKAINDSFYTKNEHIVAGVGGINYVIPSFLSLENKVNALQDNFNNLVNAPLTGEAYFNFDGNSQSIEMRGFNCAPDKLRLATPTVFGVEANNMFKDFLTPNPYVNFDLTSLPDDITTVNVKKVIPRNPELIDTFKEFLGEGVSVAKDWSDMYKLLDTYRKDTDYIEYDTLMNLPARQPNGYAQYVISKIESDEIDDNLDEIITVKIRNNFEGVADGTVYTPTLTYKLFDETIEKNLREGDCLVTYNNGTKLQIIEVRPLTNTIVVKVLNGEYLNLVESNTSTIQDLSKLKFFSEANFADTKYVHVSLEEDKYIFVAVAALNGKLRVQAPWGQGVIIDSYKLTNGTTNFETYYKENVHNIGDILYEITSLMSSTLTKYTNAQIDGVRNIKPVINTDAEHLIVSHINKHLDDSETVQNIRTLYSQKKQYETELTEIQTEIDRINEDLSSISFDDTSGQRSALIASLSADNKRKNELTTSITKIMNDISQSANSSDVPIENAKYRIRGYFDYTQLDPTGSIIPDLPSHVAGIEVWYRYKNANRMQGNAETIGTGDNPFIFTDWNIMTSFKRGKTAVYGDSSYRYTLDADNSNKNEPSFNQIEIPISKGETVDIKLRVIYDFGQPFVDITSQWSEIVNIPFPEEFSKNVQILDIITENNNEIETNRFNNILTEKGVPSHVEDRIMDQDITYFHKPENISSGFYTSERRIIPLKDKLTELDTSVRAIQDEIFGLNAKSLQVSIAIGESETVLNENVVNNISVAGPSDVVDGSTYLTEGVYEKDGVDGKHVSTILKLTLKNTSSHIIKFFPIFPGPRTNNINKYPYKDSWRDYALDNGDSTECGVWSKTYGAETGEMGISETLTLQTLNQYINFRLNDVWTGRAYYGSGAQFEEKDKLSYNKDYIELYDSGSGEYRTGAAMYPIKNNKNSLCVESDSTTEYLFLAPDESIVIPILFEYNFGEAANEYSKIMSFDLRLSLYNDPINYTFKALVKKTSVPQDKLITTIKQRNPYIKYNPTVKA